MQINKLKEAIREAIDKVLSENAPAPSKPKPSPGPAVAPGKPSTDKPKPRRPLGNPNVDPNPKAKKTMNEEEMLKKIVARFKSKKLDEGSSKVGLTAKNQDEISALSSEQKKKLYDELVDAVTEVNDKDFKTKAEYAKAMKDAKIKVYKKYIKL
jgi:hypothetical protein